MTLSHSVRASPHIVSGAPRIALFGGSFDPPHRGHLAVATAAADAFELTRVLFTPTGRQPFKPAGAQARYPDRLAMIALACETDPRFEASALDTPRADLGPNYTIDTLAKLQEENPKAELFAIIGADSFVELPRWREAPRLFELAQWIVVSRPKVPLGDLAELHFTPAQRSRVRLLETVHDPISATYLRQSLAAGQNCIGLLPAAVAQYIETHHLYQVG